jgi:hypothetical protein
MEDKNWFAALTAKRLNTVETLKENGLNTFINHIIGTYHDQAHFIYELLQNADDVKATKVRLELKRNGVLFTHNGKLKFSITNPDHERKDNTSLGHINAITAFSLSAKKDDAKSQIGKFGIGFKSVFQYTNTPHIYNPPFCFKIEKFIVPREIKLQDGFLYYKETTAFWLPFDKPDKTPERAYSEISARLDSIKNPLLFLKNVTIFDIINNTTFTRFNKEIEEIESLITPASYIKVCKVKLNDDTIIKFSKKVKITDHTSKAYFLPIDIAFVLDSNGHVTANNQYQHYFRYAWSFLPTMHETRLNYILNASFILSPNREAIKENRTENIQLINALAQLIETAIDVLDELGYITDTFDSTLPVLKHITAGFMPIAEVVINKVKADKM